MRTYLAYPQALSVRTSDPALGEALAKMQAAVINMTLRQLAELERMQTLGMRIVDEIDRVLRGKPSLDDKTLFGRNQRGICGNFKIVERAIRQIMLLQQELVGLRPSQRRERTLPLEDMPLEDMDYAPERAKRDFTGGPRDDSADFYDYRPVGQTVEWIRETLAIEPPPEDPFAAPASADAEPEAAEPQATELTPASPKRAQTAHIRDEDFPADEADAEAPTEAEVPVRRTKPPRGPP